jgi:PST family polysaccharide transporter
MTEATPSAAANARWSAISQGGRSGLRLLGLVVLSRLLEPSDFGLLALATAVTSFAEVLRDMGTSRLLIQREHLEDDTICTVFWFNVVSGVVLAAALLGLAPALAGFFVQSELTPIFWLLSLIFPGAALASTHQALLERGSRFRTLAGIEISSTLAGLIAAVTAALLGAGVYSLVIQVLLTTLVSAVLFWGYSGWLPRAVWSRRRLEEVWGFSGHLFGHNILNFLSRNADDLIVGRFLGTSKLGVYSLAYRVMMFPLQSLTAVANRALLPILSRRQSEPGAVADLYRRTLAMIALVSAPMTAGLWLVREPFVLTVFGEQWIQAAEVLAWLAPVGFVQTLVSTTGTVVLASGRTDQLMRLGAMSAVLVIASFGIGVRWGLAGVAACYLVANLLNAVPYFWAAFRSSGNSAKDLVVAVRAPLLFSGAMISTGALVDQALLGSGSSPLVRLLTVSIVGALCYGGLLLLFGRDSLNELRRLVSPQR